jgi:hypothetical protein
MNTEAMFVLRDMIRDGKVYIHLITDSKLVEIPVTGAYSANGNFILEAEVSN